MIRVFKALVNSWPESLEVKNLSGKTPLMMAQVPVSRANPEPNENVLELLRDSESRLTDWRLKLNVVMSVNRHMMSPYQRFMPPIDKKRDIGKYNHYLRNLRFAANMLIEIKDRKIEGIYANILEFAFGPRENIKEEDEEIETRRNRTSK